MPPKRRNTKSQRTAKAKFVTKEAMHRRIEGFSPKGSFDPPRITVNPWNQVVLVSRGLTQGAGAATFTSDSVFTLLRTQLGLTGLTAVLEMSIMRLGFWLDTKGDDSANLAIQPSSFLSYQAGKQTRARDWLEDVGTKTRQAHCHYVWPEAEQQFIFTSDMTAQNIFAYDTKAASLSFTIHIFVRWRSNDADQVPSFRVGEMLKALD